MPPASSPARRRERDEVPDSHGRQPSGRASSVGACQGPTGLNGNHNAVDFGGHPLDLDGKDAHGFGQCGVLGEQPDKHLGLVGSTGWPLQGQFGDVFSVLLIGDGVDLVPLRLPGLGQQDQRRCVRVLQAEGEVQEHARVEVK